MDLLQRRLIWNVLPTALVLGILYLAVWGDNGLVRRGELAVDLAKAERRLDAVRRENASLEREVARLADDPVTQRRAAAEELLLVPAYSTLYRFPSGTP
ncbi:MAG: septum formation initiator family protein [Myxococcales bacterium]|nr:septum formation initiator family protein [Myxococcales bacterium]